MEVAELIFRRAGEDLLHLRLDRAETCLGRDPTNDVVVPDSAVPEVAAVIVDKGARRFQIRDLTSGWLSINGAPIEGDEHTLESGDLIGFGEYELRFEVRTFSLGKEARTEVLDAQEAQGETAAVLEYEKHRLELSPGTPFNVGSDPDNDLVIEDGSVSSFHFRLTHGAGRWTLYDLASTNGTQINGLRVGEAELPDVAEIRAGRARLSFELLKGDENRTPSFFGMLGTSPQMVEVFRLIDRMGDLGAPVLITGPSGSGKELVARALHERSSRRSGPFLAMNCGALASSVIESELFGHTKGAFTGATADKKGAFEATDNGTLFLDEIGELPLDLQPKLLRVLETSSVRRVGGTKELPVRTRVVAATHRNLKSLMDEGRFREDLLHRLFVLNIRLPSLAERKNDILPLAEHFLKDSSPNRRMELSSQTKAKLMEYRWPGNVRELRNVILRGALMAQGSKLEPHDLEFSEDAFGTNDRHAAEQVRRADERERDKIYAVLEETGGNRAEAARILGISKSTFHDRLKRLGVPLKTKIRR